MEITYFNKKGERKTRYKGDFGSKIDLKSLIFIDEEEETRVLVMTYKKRNEKERLKYTCVLKTQKTTTNSRLMTKFTQYYWWS